MEDPPIRVISILERGDQIMKTRKGILKEAEERYRRIFEDSKDMVYITSADGKLVDINQAGVGLLGYGSQEERNKFNSSNKRDLSISPTL